MARIVIEFDTDNSAFEDDLNLKLLDSNGTTVGRVYILVGKR
jgi:hypothetical protein